MRCRRRLLALETSPQATRTAVALVIGAFGLGFVLFVLWKLRRKLRCCLPRPADEALRRDLLAFAAQLYGKEQLGVSPPSPRQPRSLPAKASRSGLCASAAPEKQEFTIKAAQSPSGPPSLPQRPPPAPSCSQLDAASQPSSPVRPHPLALSPPPPPGQQQQEAPRSPSSCRSGGGQLALEAFAAVAPPAARGELRSRPSSPGRAAGTDGAYDVDARSAVADLQRLASFLQYTQPTGSALNLSGLGSSSFAEQHLGGFEHGRSRPCTAGGRQQQSRVEHARFPAGMALPPAPHTSQWSIDAAAPMPLAPPSQHGEEASGTPAPSSLPAGSACTGAARPPARPVLPHSASSGSRGWAPSGDGGVSKRWLLHDCDELQEIAEGGD